MSTTTENSNIDTNKKSGKDNPDHARLKKCLSHKTSQECPNYSPQGHGPPSKDIGTMYYDCKFNIINICLMITICHPETTTIVLDLY